MRISDWSSDVCSSDLFAGTALPALPTDFWTAWPGDSTNPTSRWTSLGSQTVPTLNYSGASVGGSAADASQILAFDFVGPPLDPSLPAFRHHCLLAIIDSVDDPVRSEEHTSELQSLMRISYAVFCLKKKKKSKHKTYDNTYR